MAVIPLTVLVGLVLVAFFIVFFLTQASGGKSGSSERDALLPLDDERVKRTGRDAPEQGGTKTP